MSKLRDYAPSVLLDWARIHEGNLFDDVSGGTWEKTGSVAPTYDIFGGIGGNFTGDCILEMKNTPMLDEWTLVVIAARQQNLVGYGRRAFAAYVTGAPIYDSYAFHDVMSHTNGEISSNITSATTQVYYRSFKTNAYSSNMFALVRRKKTLELWTNGLLSSYVEDIDLLNGRARDLKIGGLAVGLSTYMWTGQIGDFAKFDHAFTQDEMSDMWAGVGPSAISLDCVTHRISERSFTYTGGINLEGSCVHPYSGIGALIGTVKIQISPTQQVPASRKVRIFDTTSGKLLAETWSDAKTGVWRVDGLALDRLFTVLSHDHEKEFNAVTADYRYAEVL